MGKLVSIALPAYNAGAYIEECLDSLLKQTYSNFEIILIDDCSTDHTAQVVKGFSDGRIRYFRNEKNLGIVHSLNKAYGLCRGEYIARMDADDICAPERLEKQVALLETRPGVGMVACDLKLFGNRTGQIRYSNDPDIIQCRLLFSLQMAHNAWLFRRELLDVYGLVYREEFRYAEDWDFLARASRVTKFSNVPEPLVSYRMFPQQSSSVYKTAQRAAADRVARDQLEYIGLELTNEEFRIYRAAFGKKEKLLTVAEMDTLLDVLHRMENANKEKRFYKEVVLHRVIGEEVFRLCYYNLINRRKSGLRWLRCHWIDCQEQAAQMRWKLWLRCAMTLIAGRDEL